MADDSEDKKYVPNYVETDPKTGKKYRLIKGDDCGECGGSGDDSRGRKDWTGETMNCSSCGGRGAKYTREEIKD